MTPTVLLTITCPALGIVTGYYCLTDEKFDWRSAAFCIALFMAAIAYSYIPTEPSDLVRYWENCEVLAKYPFFEALGKSSNVGNEGLWVFIGASWVVGRIGDLHILPAVSTFLVYYISLYMTGKMGEDLGAKRGEVAAFMIFIILSVNLYSIINNVRNVLSFTMGGYAVYREVYEEKRDWKTLALYIVPLFIHSSAMVVPLCRLLAPVIGKFKIAGLAGCYSIVLIIDSLHEFTSRLTSGNVVVSMIKTMVNKGYVYFHDTGSSWGTVSQRSGSIRAAKALNFVIVFIMCILACFCDDYFEKHITQNNKKKLQKIRIMTDFCFIIGLLTIASMPMLTPSYWRFAAALYLLGAPIYFSLGLLEEARDTSKIQDIMFEAMKYTMFIMALGCFLLWVRDMRHCEMDRLLTQPFLCSPVVVFFGFLFNKIAFYL